MNQVSAIIPAAGIGSRFGEPKQFKILAGHTLFFHSLKIFLYSNFIKEIILVVPQHYTEIIYNDLKSISYKKRVKIISGGDHRQDSVKKGLNVSSESTNLVCIHDAARPFVTENMIERSILACKKYDGSVVALPSVDTVKLSDNGQIKETLDRKRVWLAQTPQSFIKDKLIAAFEHADKNNIIGTDESKLMEVMGFSIKLIEGDPTNFKITTREDWERANQICIRKSMKKDSEE